jgi:hypothetical protein
MIRALIKAEGVLALYNGYFATLLRNAPGAMLKFGIYEQLKSTAQKILRRPLLPQEHFAAGITAGCISSVATTPLDVVKTRLMTGQVKASSPIGAMFIIARVSIYIYTYDMNTYYIHT